MTDATTFSDLVAEAFIEPLRSVLIVDDQYPTWEEILNDKIGEGERDKELESRSSKKDWRDNPNGPISVIKQFRSRKPGFVIDIHDGLTPETATGEIGGKNEADANQVELANHLHQSDLLVLDYNLEGADSGLGGSKARSILQSVLSNKHFNLVVVHTGEKSLEQVFFECVMKLLPSCTSQFDDTQLKELRILDEKFDDLEQAEKFNREQFLEKIDPVEYLKLRHPNTNSQRSLVEFMRSTGPFALVSKYAKELGLRGRELRYFFYWSIREFEKTKDLANFADEPFEGLTWVNNGGCMWLRTVRGFVAFVSKGPDDLLGELQNALESWKPTPSRLLSAKYRHELSSVGVQAEDRTLLKTHVFAYFYKDFCLSGNENLSPGETERLRKAKLKAHVSRQSEAISFHIEDEVVRFGEKIRETDEVTDGNFATHYGVDLKDENTLEVKKAIAHYNSYVSTLPLKEDNDQLDCGHIFKWNSEWWVCATPVCDLQPGQNTTAFIGNSSKQRPFTALKLLSVGDGEGLTNDHINSGTYCFVETEPGVVICLGLQSIESSNSVPNGKVTWRTFVAENNGLIVDRKMQLIVPKFNEDELELESGNAEIVAKLRYEYALNYIQKVGASVTRIGLGYMS